MKTTTMTRGRIADKITQLQARHDDLVHQLPAEPAAPYPPMVRLVNRLDNDLDVPQARFEFALALRYQIACSQVASATII